MIYDFADYLTFPILKHSNFNRLIELNNTLQRRVDSAWNQNIAWDCILSEIDWSTMQCWCSTKHSGATK